MNKIKAEQDADELQAHLAVFLPEHPGLAEHMAGDWDGDLSLKLGPSNHDQNLQTVRDIIEGRVPYTDEVRVVGHWRCQARRLCAGKLVLACLVATPKCQACCIWLGCAHRSQPLVALMPCCAGGCAHRLGAGGHLVQALEGPRHVGPLQHRGPAGKSVQLGVRGWWLGAVVCACLNCTPGLPCKAKVTDQLPMCPTAPTPQGKGTIRRVNNNGLQLILFNKCAYVLME